MRYTSDDLDLKDKVEKIELDRGSFKTVFTTPKGLIGLLALILGPLCAAYTGYTGKTVDPNIAVLIQAINKQNEVNKGPDPKVLEALLEELKKFKDEKKKVDFQQETNIHEMNIHEQDPLQEVVKQLRVDLDSLEFRFAQSLKVPKIQESIQESIPESIQESSCSQGSCSPAPQRLFFRRR